jgi:hypothetical protein
MVKNSAFSLLVVACLFAGFVTPAAGQAQNNVPAKQPVHMQFTPGTLVRAEIEKPIDAKKAQVGDQVFAKTTSDLKSDPPGLATHGCKVLGHVVEVTQHQGDSTSTLGIAFDKMVLKDGTEIALPAMIQAIGFMDSINMVSNEQMMNNMGGNVGTTQVAGDINSGSGNPAGYAGERMPMATSNQINLPFNAQGVYGISGVLLSTGTQQESLLSAKKHNVKIDNGIQMILRTQ